jgi:hypothetical protein
LELVQDVKPGGSREIPSENLKKQWKIHDQWTLIAGKQRHTPPMTPKFRDPTHSTTVTKALDAALGTCEGTPGRVPRRNTS